MTKKISDINTVSEVLELFKENNYIGNNQIAFTVLNAFQLGMPILIEGPAGLGKTELAKVVSNSLDLELIRLQCYEGIDYSKSLYEYDYLKQILVSQAVDGSFKELVKGLEINEAMTKVANDVHFFNEVFLMKRPLLQSITSEKRSVLLIDEIDKSDEEFEALLLQLLSDFEISIPEYGTVSCKDDKRPIVFLTSNGNRELSDALKRRCLYLYIDYPTQDVEGKIISLKAEVDSEFALKVAKKVAQIRKLNLKQAPSISESIIWAKSLMANFGEDVFEKFNSSIINETLGLLLKNNNDIKIVESKFNQL